MRYDPASLSIVGLNFLGDVLMRGHEDLLLHLQQAVLPRSRKRRLRKRLEKMAANMIDLTEQHLLLSRGQGTQSRN